MPIEDKKKLLRETAKKCIINAKLYKRRHKKLKFIDDIIDSFLSGCCACSMSLTILGITFPLLLVPSAVLSGVAFIVSQIQRQYNFKHKYNMDAITYTQLKELSREINVILRKNHLSNNDLIDVIEDINNKISLIEDTAIII